MYFSFSFFFFNDTATTEIYTLSLHDALPISYYSSKTFNPVTNEEQYLSITPSQEIALGLQSVEPMTQQYGGLYPDPEIQQFLDDVCNNLIIYSAAGETDWPFECNLLADENTVNAFALPGGQMFMTLALYNRLETEGQVRSKSVV